MENNINTSIDLTHFIIQIPAGTFLILKEKITEFLKEYNLTKFNLISFSCFIHQNNIEKFDNLILFSLYFKNTESCTYYLCDDKTMKYTLEDEIGSGLLNLIKIDTKYAFKK